jgi:hypothetical protein
MFPVLRLFCGSAHDSINLIDFDSLHAVTAR